MLTFGDHKRLTEEALPLVRDRFQDERIQVMPHTYDRKKFNPRTKNGRLMKNVLFARHIGVFKYQKQGSYEQIVFFSAIDQYGPRDPNGRPIMSHSGMLNEPFSSVESVMNVTRNIQQSGIADLVIQSGNAQNYMVGNSVNAPLLSRYREGMKAPMVSANDFMDALNLWKALNTVVGVERLQMLLSKP